MKVIGIDIGTTSICGVIADAVSGEIVKSVTLPNTSFIITDKEYERIQDTDVIMDTVYKILDELDAKSADVIGFSGQMHGIVYTDANGNAVSPLYIWQDTRANLEYKDGRSYAEILGCFAGYGLATDFYNSVNGLIPENAKYLCTVADYAVMQLCGNKIPVCHITNAASLGCFDVEKNVFKIDNPRLPEVETGFVSCGNYNGVPVCVALGDNQASFIGSVRNTADVLLNVGTGAQISWLSESPVKAESVEIRPFDGKRYLMAGCSLCGGRAYAMFEKFCREIALTAGADIDSFYPFLDKMLLSKKRSEIIGDCRFCGTRNNPHLRGSYSGISENNFTPADFAYATLDGMAAELFDMYASADKRASGLVCSGNGIRKNAALRKIVSDKFGCGIKIPLYEEEAAYGAALSAVVGGGISADIDSACSIIKYKDE
ncbi:MAG: hypothetical protein IKB88_06695 [Clostridia bacterium]|nr:hypothetical protein [Clostridia bacterium]